MIQTQPILEGGENSHHCTIPASEIINANTVSHLGEGSYGEGMVAVVAGALNFQ